MFFEGNYRTFGNVFFFRRTCSWQQRSRKKCLLGWMNEPSCTFSSFLSIFVCRSLSPLFRDNGSAYFLEARTRPSLFHRLWYFPLYFSSSFLGHSILGGGQGLRLHCVSWERRARPTSNQGEIHQSKSYSKKSPEFWRLFSLYVCIYEEILSLLSDPAPSCYNATPFVVVLGSSLPPHPSPPFPPPLKRPPGSSAASNGKRKRGGGGEASQSHKTGKELPRPRLLRLSQDNGGNIPTTSLSSFLPRRQKNRIVVQKEKEKSGEMKGVFVMRHVIACSGNHGQWEKEKEISSTSRSSFFAVYKVLLFLCEGGEMEVLQ